jgi:hypothetical protein
LQFRSSTLQQPEHLPLAKQRSIFYLVKAGFPRPLFGILLLHPADEEFA